MAAPSSTYQQSGPSSPQAARAVLAELPNQQKSFGDLPAYLNTNNGPNKDLRIQARASGSGGEAITVAFVANGLNSALSVAVNGNAIQVNLATDDVNVATPRTVTDGTTQVGTNVTSATANFKQSDLHATISGGTIPGGATITAVNSATSVTISAPATAVASGVSITITPSNGSSASTARDVVKLLNSDVNASPLVAAAVVNGDGSGYVSPFSAIALSGDLAASYGTDGSSAPLPKQHPIANRYA